MRRRNYGLGRCRRNRRYFISEVNGTRDTIDYLFTLGCYKGEKIRVISKIASNYVISIKDSRYAIDNQMADNIRVFLND